MFCSILEFTCLRDMQIRRAKPEAKAKYPLGDGQGLSFTCERR